MPGPWYSLYPTRVNGQTAGNQWPRHFNLSPRKTEFQERKPPSPRCSAIKRLLDAIHTPSTAGKNPIDCVGKTFGAVITQNSPRQKFVLKPRKFHAWTYTIFRWENAVNTVSVLEYVDSCALNTAVKLVWCSPPRCHAIPAPRNSFASTVNYYHTLFWQCPLMPYVHSMPATDASRSQNYNRPMNIG